MQKLLTQHCLHGQEFDEKGYTLGYPLGEQEAIEAPTSLSGPRLMPRSLECMYFVVYLSHSLVCLPYLVGDSITCLLQIMCFYKPIWYMIFYLFDSVSLLEDAIFSPGCCPCFPSLDRKGQEKATQSCQKLSARTGIISLNQSAPLWAVASAA